MEHAFRNDDWLHEVPLGLMGLKYVRDTLASGRELSLALLRSVDFEFGSVVAVIPRSVSFADATDFFTGGKLPSRSPSVSDTLSRSNMRQERIPNLYPVLAQRIQKHLASDTTAIGVFEDAMALPHDPWVKNAPFRLLLTHSGVYYLLVSGDSEQTIGRTVQRASSIRPPLIGVLARRRSPTTRPVDEQDLHGIAATAETVIVGAYDGESFVLWRPPIQKPIS
jgi:hypothetical protein